MNRMIFFVQNFMYDHENIFLLIFDKRDVVHANLCRLEFPSLATPSGIIQKSRSGRNSKLELVNFNSNSDTHFLKTLVLDEKSIKSCTFSQCIAYKSNCKAQKWCCAILNFHDHFLSLKS